MQKAALLMSLGLALLLNGSAVALESPVDEAVEAVTLRGEKLLEELKAGFRHLAGLDKAAPGTMAVVNGHTISLRQLEALYDMHTAGRDQAQARTPDELHVAYASCLQRLIVQQLVHEEVEKRARGVTEEERVQAEKRLLGEYGLREPRELDLVIREEGIDPLLWRAQLRATLEQRRLQTLLAEAYEPSPADIDNYIRSHPELSKEEESCRYLSVSGADRKKLEKLREAGKKDRAELEKAGMRVEEVQDWTRDLPPSLRNALADTKVGESLPVQAGGNEWGYVILLEREQTRSRSALEIYTLAQKELRRTALPLLYERWLTAAVAAAEIRMVPQLQPHNVPRASSRSFPGYAPVREQQPELPLPEASLPED